MDRTYIPQMHGKEAGDAANWERLESLYDAASALPLAEREAFLAAECAADPALRRELDALFECAPAAERFFTSFSDVVGAAITDPLPSSDPLVGATVSRYRVEARLGAGGMGVVYRAHDTQLQRVVALKVLSPHLSADESARKRFLIEARAAAALDHPNICTVYETGETDAGQPYIAMALCGGETLKARIARGGLTTSEAVRIALQIARGLAAAHARGIRHRDVKPANVMVGEDGLVKVVDFGLARLSDVTGTTSGMARGTFAYMAPELLRGQQADAQTDLWSLGVVLYEMLTGNRPFRADSDAALLYTIVHERPAPLAEVRPDLPDDLRYIVDRLLHEDPSVRYHDAGDLIADLEPLITSPQTPVLGRTIKRAPGRLRRVPAWKRWALAAVAAVVVVSVALLATRDRAAPAAGRTTTEPRVAVLFFHDDTQDRSAGSIASTLTSRLIDVLARVPGLDVPGLNAMQPYRDRSLSIPTVANGLSAAWLVGGFVESSGDRIVVTTELSDSTGRRLDSRRVEQRAGGEQELIDETVEAVATMLRSRVGEALRERRRREGTANPQALALVQQAMQHVADADSLVERSQPRTAMTALQRADDALARAASADPKWAEPRIERAWVARELAYLTFGLGMGADSLRAAVDYGIEYASAALSSGQDAGRAYEVRGVLRHARSLLLPDAGSLGAKRRFADAEKDLQSAVESDPTLARALNVLSMIQFERGDFEQARLTTERAYRADYYFQAPDIVHRLFSTTFETGQDDQAREWCTLIRRRFPEYFAYCRLTLMTWSAGDRADPDSARELVAHAKATAPTAIRPMVSTQMDVLFAGVVARAVSGDSAERILHRARANQAAAQLDANSQLVLLEFEAAVRARLGQTDSAVALIKRYIDSRPGERDRLSKSRIFSSLFRDAQLDANAAARN